jgi:hypothetical protein
MRVSDDVRIMVTRAGIGWRCRKTDKRQRCDETSHANVLG